MQARASSRSGEIAVSCGRPPIFTDEGACPDFLLAIAHQSTELLIQPLPYHADAELLRTSHRACCHECCNHLHPGACISFILPNKCQIK